MVMITPAIQEKHLIKRKNKSRKLAKGPKPLLFSIV